MVWIVLILRLAESRRPGNEFTAGFYMKSRFVLGLGLTVALSVPNVASGDFIFDSSLGGVTGSGLGAVATILTIQSPGSGTAESGSVSRSGGADVKSDTGVVASGGTTSVGNVKTGASQTQTQTFGGNGITQAAQIAIVFNAAEPGGNSVNLTGLQMSVFNGNADIFDAHLPTAKNFAATFTGIGKEGFVFKLDSSEAATLQGLLNSLTAAQVAALRIGLSASVGDATGGPETFNLATITPVPEPITMFLSGTGLLLLGYAARKRLLGGQRATGI